MMMVPECSKRAANFTLFAQFYAWERFPPAKHYTQPTHCLHEANNSGNCCILQPQAALQLSSSRLDDNSIRTHTHTHTYMSSYMTATWLNCTPPLPWDALLSSFGLENFNWLLAFCSLIKCKLCQKRSQIVYAASRICWEREREREREVAFLCTAGYTIRTSKLVEKYLGICWKLLYFQLRTFPQSVRALRVPQRSFNCRNRL